MDAGRRSGSGVGNGHGGRAGDRDRRRQRVRMAPVPAGSGGPAPRARRRYRRAGRRRRDRASGADVVVAAGRSCRARAVPGGSSAATIAEAMRPRRMPPRRVAETERMFYHRTRPQPPGAVPMSPAAARSASSTRTPTSRSSTEPPLGGPGGAGRRAGLRRPGRDRPPGPRTGPVRFVSAAQEAGLRPIVGLEVELLDAAVAGPRWGRGAPSSPSTPRVAGPVVEAGLLSGVVPAAGVATASGHGLGRRGSAGPPRVERLRPPATASRSAMSSAGRAIASVAPTSSCWPAT